MKKICVVGAGTVGLSCALRIKQELEDSADVTVVADAFMNQTTSYGSGGLWEPYQIAGTPDEDVNRWGKYAFDHFLELYHSSSCGRAGVQLMTTYCLFTEDQDCSPPSWRDIVFNFHDISGEELQRMGLPSKFTAGFTFTTLVIEQKYYMAWLTKELEALGVHFEQRHLDSLEEISGYDAIINCTGIGAAKLLGDTEMYPIRGQVLRVRAPWIKNVWMFGGNYLIPNVDSVVVGGTAQKGDWNTTVSLEDTENILDEVSKLFPSIREAPIETVWAGLRPGRTPLRLDSEIKTMGHNLVPVVHCYGHGGSGITLAMGCAQDVLTNHLIPLLRECDSLRICGQQSTWIKHSSRL